MQTREDPPLLVQVIHLQIVLVIGELCELADQPRDHHLGGRALLQLARGVGDQRIEVALRDVDGPREQVGLEFDPYALHARHAVYRLRLRLTERVIPLLRDVVKFKYTVLDFNIYNFLVLVILFLYLYIGYNSYYHLP